MSNPVPIVRKIKNWVYIVQPGDTLASITVKLSGNSNRYYELVGANPQKEHTQAPFGFRYHFFKDLIEGEKLKIPANWRSKEVAFGIGIDPFQILNPNDMLNQFPDFNTLLNQWYNGGNPILPPGVTLPQGFPQGLEQQVIDKIADVIIAWQPYTGLPDLTNPNYIVTTLLNVVSADPNYYKLMDLFTQAATFIDLTKNNPIPTSILTTIPWNTVPWGYFDQIIPVFNQVDQYIPGGFYNWLSRIKSQVAPPPPVINWTQTRMIAGVGNGVQQNIWNPAYVNAVDPTILNQIPWDKIGAIDWAAATAAIQKWGIGTPADIQATKICWDKCVIDINQATVDDFFHDVSADPQHGCCRWKCATNTECAGSPGKTCQPGQHVDFSGNCVNACPEGQIWNTKTGYCESLESPPLESLPECDSSHPCKNGDCINGKCKETGPGGTKKDEGKPTPPKDNTIIYVISGLVGLLIIGGTIIAVSGKDKSEGESRPATSTI